VSTDTPQESQGARGRRFAQALDPDAARFNASVAR